MPKLPRETVERFLGLFAVSIDELKTELAACEKPWQMLPLQTRPLLRLNEEVLILDESFLLEAITAGLINHWSFGGREDTSRVPPRVTKPVAKPGAGSIEGDRSWTT